VKTKQFLAILVLFPLFATACTTSQPKDQVYLPTFLPTQSRIPATQRPIPTGPVLVNPPTPAPTFEFQFPTNDPYKLFGTSLAQQPGQSLTQSAGGALEAARQSLSQTLGVPLDQISTVRVEDETWPDMCFGIPGAFTECGQFMMPGYRITLRAYGLDYHYYSNADGTRILLVNQP
jgi:hypothetical protein